MQSLPVYLYANLFEVTLDLDDNTRIRQVMYQRPLKIQKGVENTVRVQFKNSDQKLLQINNRNFKMYVYDTADDRALVLQKNVDVLDTGSTATVYSSKGLGEIVFTEKDTQDIESKHYNFSIVEVAEDGTESPSYANTYYEVAGVLELRDEITPRVRPTIAITDFQRYYNSDVGKMQWEYDTGNIRVYPERSKKTALHTVAFYMTRFRGTVLVEGTLENSPTTFGRYAVIETRTYNNFTGIDYLNFTGIFTHIKVTYIRAKNPTDGNNEDTAYAGFFDKVLIRS